MKRSEINILSAPIMRGVFSLSLPIIIMNVIQVLFTIVDMTVLKTYDLQGTAVGAVGACGTLIVFISNPLILISAGATVAVARAIGEGNQEHTDQAVGTSIAFALLSGIVLAVIGVPFAETFLRFTNCPESLMEQAALYFRLYFAGSPILLLYNFCAAIMRAAGDSRRPMVFLIIGGIFKIVCNYIFVACFDMSVGGVGLSTILSWGLSAALCAGVLIRGTGVIKISFRKIRFYSQALKILLRVGMPAGIQEGLISSANVLIATAVNSFGPNATTGISIANNFDSVIYHVSVAPSFAVLSFVSQNVGAGNEKRVAKSVGAGILVTTVLGATIGLLFAVFSGELSLLMSSDPAVIAFSRQKMLMISSTYFLCGINENLCAALRGMGRSTLVAVVALISMCVSRFAWVYLIFPLEPTIPFLYLIWPISWVLSIVVLLLFYFPTLKRINYKHSSIEKIST